MNKDIIILAHSEVFNQGDQTAERPLAPGGAKNDVYQMCDQIGLIYNLADRNSEGGMRQIMWDPTDTAIGKNSGELEPTAVPPVSEDTQFLSPSHRRHQSQYQPSLTGEPERQHGQPGTPDKPR